MNVCRSIPPLADAGDFIRSIADFNQLYPALHSKQIQSLISRRRTQPFSDRSENPGIEVLSNNTIFSFQLVIATTFDI